LHKLLTAEPDLRKQIEAEAIGFCSRPTTNLELAWREGRRSLAVEWYSMYQEVENERT
jgi:hypothetical protein